MSGQAFVLGVGYATCGIAAVAALGGALWLSTDFAWKAFQMTSFGARVLKKGLKVEAEDRRRVKRAPTQPPEAQADAPRAPKTDPEVEI